MIESLFDLCFGFSREEGRVGKRREGQTVATFEVINLKCNFLISQADKKLLARHLPRTKIIIMFNDAII